MINGKPLFAKNANAFTGINNTEKPKQPNELATSQGIILPNQAVGFSPAGGSIFSNNKQKQSPFGQKNALNFGGQPSTQPNPSAPTFPIKVVPTTTTPSQSFLPPKMESNTQDPFKMNLGQPTPPSSKAQINNLGQGFKPSNPPAQTQQKTSLPSFSISSSPNSKMQSHSDSSNLQTLKSEKPNPKPTVPKSNPIKNANKYIKNYNPLSQFDIVNHYYQIKEHPEEVEQNLVLNLSRNLKNLFKNKEHSDTNYSIDKIKFAELTAVQEPILTNIKKFWLALITQFIKNHHPYCTFDGVVALIQFHFKQNHDIYYPNGQFNSQIYRQNYILNGLIDKESQFFTAILYTLQRMLSVYINQFCTIVSSIPASLTDKLLQKQQIITNIWNVFKLLYNSDYQLKEESGIRLKIANDLISTMYVIHGKNPACFGKSGVVDIVEFFDTHLQYICGGLNIRVSGVDDKSASNMLGRKYIRLINLLVFRFPYQLEKWDQQLKNCIKGIKSECLIPLKWITNQGKKPESTHMILGRADPQDQYGYYYFPIVGSEWLLLLQNLIEFEQSNLITNQHYKQIIFYLLCSVIEENPIGFWTNMHEFEQIHNYISNLYINAQNQGVHSANYSSQLGKLCRIMMCACGQRSQLNQNQQNISQALQKLKHDSIMLKIRNEQQEEYQDRKLSNLVFNNFASSVIGIKNVDRRALFGEMLMGYLFTHEEQFPIYNYDDPIVLKYHYQFPNVLIHELFIRIIIDNPEIIGHLYQLWQQQARKYEYQQQPSSTQPQVQLSNFLYKFTITYTLNIQQSYFTTQPQPESQTSPSSIQILPQTLQLLNKMLLNQNTRIIVQTLLNREDVMHNGEIQELLNKAMMYQVNVNALTRHLEVLYGLGLDGIGWVREICMPIVEKVLGQWEESVARFYANITRIAVHKQCLSKNPHSSLSQLNTLAIDPRTELLGSETNNEQLYLVKIQQLTKYSDYILQFIMWALKIQEDILREEYFYNSLLIKGKYQSLEAALKLLEVLIVVYMRFHSRVYFTEKLKRFLSICNVSNKLGYSSFPNNSKLSVAPPIKLTNKKLATLPAALTYLICQPLVSRSTKLRENETIRAKQIRSRALNILNLIILNNNTTISYLYSMQDSIESLQDSFSSIDFNVYEQFFVNDSEKIYCSSEKLLIDYIKSEISNKNNTLSLTPITWFQSSYNYGQSLDIVTQTNKLFNDPAINQAIQARINTEFESGEKLRLEMRKVMTKFCLENNFEARYATRDVMPTFLNDYLCDREVVGYSRYLLQLALASNQHNAYQQQFFLKILSVVLNKLLNVIVEQPECVEKSLIIQPITTNIWKAIRILQTKKDLKFFVKIVKRSLPFILSTYHLSIDTNEYVDEYLITIRLILACREYFQPILYSQVLSVDGLKQMLIDLMREAAEKPKFYTALFYCLNFYHNLVEYEKSSKEEFKAQLLSLYNSVNETINPLTVAEFQRKNSKKRAEKQQIHELCKDVTVIQLIMFFKLHIPEKISSNSQSLYNLLLTAIDRSTTFNYQSLLLNIEPKPTKQSIEAALQVANASHHYLQYISACNHIYRALANIDKSSIDQDQPRSVYNIMGDKIVTFIERGLDLQPVSDLSRTGDNWRNIVFMKSWACNLLYLLMGFCSRPLLIKICQMLLNKTNLLSLLGELLSIYGSVPIRWEYSGSRVVSMSRLGLLEKQLLLSILKVYTVMIAKSDDWVKKSGDISRNSVYHSLCKSFVSCSKVLNNNGSRLSNFQQFRDNRVTLFSPVPSSAARSEFEESLQKITKDQLYKPYLTNFQNRLQQANTMRSSQPNFKIDASKLLQLHPECSNSLDVLHSHLNLLITQQYLMILMGCYSSQQVTLETYEYNEILSIFENTTKRLADIYDYRQIFQNVMNIVDAKLWNSYRMNTNLYYLNTIHESPRETLDLLNSVAEICFNCIVNLKNVMEMHKDYREFMTKTDKTLRQAVKADKAIAFGLKDSMEANGFDKRSQYGTSYMMSPSARLSR